MMTAQKPLAESPGKPCTIRTAHDSEIAWLRRCLIENADAWHAVDVPKSSGSTDDENLAASALTYWVAESPADSMTADKIVLGGVGLELLPDGRGQLYGPQNNPHAKQESTRALLQHVVAQSRKNQQLRCLQSLSKNNDIMAFKLFTDFGFQSITSVAFLVAPLAPTVAGECTARLGTARLALEAVGTTSRGRIADVARHTRQGSDDFPELPDDWGIFHDLSATRRAQEAPEKSAGAGVDRRYWIARLDQRDAGLLIGEFNTEHHHARCVYLGVIPELRGYGWGGRMLQYLRMESAAAGCRQIYVECDARNERAIRLYAADGFYVYDERQLWIHMNSPPVA